jgi:hypothetical protein
MRKPAIDADARGRYNGFDPPTVQTLERGQGLAAAAAQATMRCLFFVSTVYVPADVATAISTE